MKKKFVITLVAMLAVIFAGKAAISGDWKLYATFDNYVDKVVDTADRTYILVLGQPYDSSGTNATLAKRYPFLYVYDKSWDTIEAYTSRNMLSESIISNIYYHPTKKYLLIVYDNCNIDVLEADGTMHNIPGLKTASVMGSKTVNDATFDEDADRVYLATDFGYVVLNDKKFEIAESRNYNKKFNSFAKLGDYYVATSDDGLYTASASDRVMSMDSYKKSDNISTAAYSLLPLSGNKGIVMLPTLGGSTRVPHILDIKDSGEVASTVLINDKTLSASRNKEGWFLSMESRVAQIDPTGEARHVRMPDDLKGAVAGSWDFNGFQFMSPRKGLTGYRYSGGSWEREFDYIAPNSPATFLCSDMEYSPQYGVLTVIHASTDYIFNAVRKEPLLISGLKNGEWSEYSPAYTYPERGIFMYESNGIAVAPENEDLIYVTSRFNGLARLDVSNPQNLLHLSGPKDDDKGKEGFHEVVGQNKAWDILCHFSEPAFDKDGNLFMLYANGTSETGYNGPVWVWPAEKRRAEDVSGFKSLKHTFQSVAHGSKILPLKHSSNKNYLIICCGSWDQQAVLIDHKGTIEDTSDDVVVTMSNIIDQDGASVTNNRIFNFYEDPSTGYVWVASYNGTFYLNPSEVFQNPSLVRRVKVSRNDGTNLADYLLDNITVHEIAVDGKGRKWFGTAGGGIVITTSDGREVLQEFTTENSYLPGNTVYSMMYNPESNSMVISTDAGLCEFFMSGASSESGNELDAVKAYPNPVRPDFLGWVTIEGLADGSLVKIVDSQGNLVRELGRIDGGSAQWDVCNYDLKRVKTGVYYVAISATSGDSNFAKVAKILVVN